jgi:hypothetical protein
MKELGSTLPWRKGKGVIGEGMFPKVHYIGRIGLDEANLSSEDYPPSRLFLAPGSKQTLFLYSQHVLSK